MLLLGKVDNKTRAVGLDAVTHGILTVEYAHHQIHEGKSFSAYYSVTTAATNGHRSGLYLKTPATPNCHLVVEFSASAAANFSICEAPTIAANTGTHGVVIYNRRRSSANTSGVTDNATSPADNKVTTLTEAQIAGDGTWATGTVIRTAPLQVGTGPFPAGGSDRGSQEYILKPSTAYVFLITNTTASANTHHILIDWYEHTDKD